MSAALPPPVESTVEGNPIVTEGELLEEADRLLSMLCEAYRSGRGDALRYVEQAGFGLFALMNELGRTQISEACLNDLETIVLAAIWCDPNAVRDGAMVRIKRARDALWE